MGVLSLFTIDQGMFFMMQAVPMAGQAIAIPIAGNFVLFFCSTS
jgi:hypothetical protein